MVVRSRKFVIDNDRLGDRRHRTEDRELLSTYSGNKASGQVSHGGAIYVRNADGPVTIDGPRIFRNEASRGGGIALERTRQEAGAAAHLIRLSNIWMYENEALPTAQHREILRVIRQAVSGIRRGATPIEIQRALMLSPAQEELLRDPKEDRGKGGGLFTTGTQFEIQDSIFQRNTAGHGGGAYVERGRADFGGIVLFRENRVFRWGGALKLFDCMPPGFGPLGPIVSKGLLHVQGNVSLHGTGGIHIAKSELVLSDQSLVEDNIAKIVGGGISLNRGAKLTLEPGTRLILKNNISERLGKLSGAGAIFSFPGKTNIVELREESGKAATVSCQANKPNNTLGVEVPGC